MTRRRALLANLGLLALATVATFAAVELGYRLLDPFPYLPPWRTNRSEYGNLTQYDPQLGWRGVPSGDAVFATRNAVTRLHHNARGYRDVEDDARAPGRPAIVFLGDSFTWGYEVEQDEMFVEHVRRAIPEREIVNLSHRGWGTDQELLAFLEWTPDRSLDAAVLMMSDNDVDDNNGAERSHKPKPRFDVRDGELVLTGTPVPRVAEWDEPQRRRSDAAPTRAEWWRALVFRSHFVHDLHFRLERLADEPSRRGGGGVPACDGRELHRTRRLVRRLRDEVEGRGGRLVVFAIPAVAELVARGEHHPYQRCIEEICTRFEIEYHDLAPALKSERLRTYYRWGGHWNPRGHRVAADAIASALRTGHQRAGGP